MMALLVLHDGEGPFATVPAATTSTPPTAL